MPADPVKAGRKGGASRSEKKLAACRRNGFQKVYTDRAPATQPQVPAPAQKVQPVLFVQKAESE